jgi:hypothetical protein
VAYEALSQGDEYRSWAALCDAEAGCFNHIPVRDVQSSRGELILDFLAVATESLGHEPLNVFDHQGPRPKCACQPKYFREEIPLVIGAELATCNAERRTGDPSRQEIDRPLSAALRDVVPDVLGGDGGAGGQAEPAGVGGEGCACVGVLLDQVHEPEPSLNQAKRLAAGSCA